MEFQLTKSEIKSYNKSRKRNLRSSICHAPNNGLYFGVGGMVTSCCVNRSYLLGRYPEQSLKDIWFGDRRNHLDQALSKGDCSSGCTVCYHGIRSNNLTGLSARSYDGLSEKNPVYPKKIDFELSNRCNLECIMCRGERSSSIRKNREKLPPIKEVYGGDFLDQLEEFLPHVENCQFLGGEPFMIPIYLDIWEKLMDINPSVRVSVQTNATILTDRVKRILEAMNFDISISIDAVHPDLFEKIRINGNFEKVVKNIDYFIDYCARKGTTLSMSYTPMTVNAHELSDVVHFCNKRGIKLFFNSLEYPQYLSIKNLPEEKLREIVDQMSEASFPQDNEIQVSNKTVFNDQLQLMSYWYKGAKASKEHEPTSKYSNIEEYFDDFNLFLDQNEKKGKYPLIREKVEFLLTEAENKNKLPKVESFILSVPFEKLLRYGSELSKEELIVSFESGVEKL